jgi:hypothetical protein
MSSNHPDKNAEGGRFTGKVTSGSMGGVLTVEYCEAKANASGKVPVRWGEYLTACEQEMQLKLESTRQEGPNGLEEYRGSEKLKNKKAIITGGVSSPTYPHLIKVPESDGA